MDGNDVLRAAELVEEMLASHLAADWSVPVPGLDFTVASVTAHLANALAWYPLDLWSGQGDDAAFEIKVATDAPNPQLLASLRAGSRVLAAVIDAAPADTRGFHPVGSPDPDGFAAMACDELLVHGRDAATGLGTSFAPDAGLARRVLDRLFPWHRPQAEADSDPWRTLLWANGRTEIPGRPNQTRWLWHCRPLAEWDGMTVPTMRSTA